MKTTVYFFTVLMLIFSITSKAQIISFKDSTFNNLKDAYKNPKQVYKLRLVNQHINTDTLDFSIFINLQQLALSYDSLINLPNGLEKLEKLTILDISSNGFIQLPKQLALIPNLQELYLNNEQQLDVNQSFSVINKMPSLKKLYLDSIPNFYFPQTMLVNNSIEYLSIRYDGLNKIPRQLSKFKHLKGLDMEGNYIANIDIILLKNNELESLSISISPEFNFKKSFTILSKEPKLNSLTISNSNLDLFAGDFSLLNNITSLSLRNDHLKIFPTSILRIKSLKNLDLTGNDFVFLPSNFLTLNKLEILNLSGNSFLNFNQTADLIRNLPSIHLLHVQDYDFTFHQDSYLQLKKNVNYVELSTVSKKSSTVHIFKGIRTVYKPLQNSRFNNFNAEGFGIRLGF